MKETHKTRSELRPKMTIESSGMSVVLSTLSWIVTLAIGGYLITIYQALPEQVPSHFGLGGETDATGGKALVWVVLSVQVSIIAGLEFLVKIPHLLNYPVRITEENAAGQYRKAIELLRLLQAVIALSFAFILYRISRIALGEADGLGSAFLPIFCAAVFLPIAYYVVSATRKSG